MLIELSYQLSESSPHWPTNPNEEYYAIASPEKGDVNTASSVYHHLHNGTHVDAPRHFDDKGKTIEKLPIEDFFYTNPFVLKCLKDKGEMIEIDDVKPYEDNLKKSDIIFFYTGHSQYRKSSPDLFSNDFPYISPSLAIYLRKELPNLKAIALDVLSVDSPLLGGKMGFPAHHGLLCTNEDTPERTILIFEDVNISRLLDFPLPKSICAFPVRWSGLEAAPIAMVAFL